MSEEIRLNITADDKGAKRLVDSLNKALGDLTRQQAASVRSAARAVNSTRQAVASLRQKNDATRVAIEQERARIASLRAEAEASRAAAEASRTSAAAIRAETQATSQAARAANLNTQRIIAALRARAASNAAASAASRRDAQELKNQGDAAAFAARRLSELVKLQRQQLRNIGGARAGADRISALHIQKDIAALRLQTVAAQQAMRAMRAHGAAAGGSAPPIRRHTAAIRESTSATTLNSDAVSQLTKRLLYLVAVLGGYRAFSAFIKEGMKFNEVIETANLGIASIITATSEVRDPFGNVLQGAEKLAAAVGAAERQVMKLRVAGLQTAATTDELVQAYQSAAAAGIAAGLNLDQIREVTVRIVQAAGTIGLPMQQLEQEVRSILDATIDRNSRVARVLGITNEQVRLAKSQNRLAEMLNERVHEFGTAGERAMGTWRVIKSNIRESFQVFSGDSMKAFFEQSRDLAQNFLGRVLNVDDAGVAKAMQPLVAGIQIFFDEIGDALGSAMDRVLGGAENTARWLEENIDLVREMAIRTVDVGRAVGEIVASLVVGVGHLIQWGVETGVLFTLLDGVATSLRIIAGLIAGIAKGFTDLVTHPVWSVVAIGLFSIAAGFGLISAPITVAIAGLAALGVWVNKLRGDTEKLRREELQRLKVTNDQKRAATTLIDQLRRLQLEKQGANTAELNKILQRESDILAELKEKYPEIAKGIIEASVAHGGLEKNLRASIDAYLDEQEALVKVERARQANLRQMVEITRAQLEQKDLSQKEAQRLQENLQMFTNQLAAQNAVVRTQIALAAQLESLRRQNQEQGDITSTIPNPDDDSKISKWLADYERQIRAAMDRIKNELKFTEEDLRESYETFGLSIEQYYDSINEAQTVATNKLIALLRQLRAAQVQAGSEAGVLAKTDAEIYELEVERTRDVIKNQRAMRKDWQKFKDDIDGLHVRMLQLTGEHVKAASIQTQMEFRDLRMRLEAEIDGLLSAMERLDPSGSEYSILSERLGLLRSVKVEIDLVVDHAMVDAAGKVIGDKLSKVQQDVNAESLRIEMAAATGMVRQDQLAERTIAMYERQLATMREVQAEQRRLLLGLDTVESRRQLEELEQSILQIEVALIQAVEGARVLRNALRDALESGLSTLFSTGIFDAYDTVMRKQQELRDQTMRVADELDAALEKHGVGLQERTEAIVAYLEEARSEIKETVTTLDVLKEAFRSFALGVVQALQQVIAQMIAMRVVAAGLNMIPGAGAAQVVQTRAAGGYITGPGTGTSDSIPARLSHGEYVLRASVVKELGVDALDQINFGRSRPALRGHRRAFAEGGLAQAGSGGAVTGGFDATLGLAPGLVVEHLRSREGTKAVVALLGDNRKAIRAALGV